MDSPVRYGHAPGSLPLIGHAHRLLRDPLVFLMSLPRHGDIVRIRLGAGHALVVCDPALARQVLRNDRIYDKNDALLVNLREILGNGLATCPHSAHRRQRRLIQPAFRRDRMAGYARIMTSHITEAVSSWHDGQELDALTAMTHLTTRVAVATMLSDRLAPGPAGQLARDLTATMTAGLVRSMVPRALLRLPLPVNLRYSEARSRIRRTVDGLIADARSDAGDRGDLLSVLIARGEDGGDAFTDAEVADQISTFFFAGIETTANLLASVLNVITLNPDIQDRMRAELRGASRAGEPGLAWLPELALTNRVISETLRLYPPVWMTPRKTSVDTELGGHLIQAGTTVIVSAFQLHRVPGLYPCPADFDPRRWAAGTKPPRDMFFPYGGGARRCIGDEFGHIQAVIVLAALLTRWRLQAVGGPRYRGDCRSASRPPGLRLRLTRAVTAPPSAPQAGPAPGARARSPGGRPR